jgi:hypothetical protein
MAHTSGIGLSRPLSHIDVREDYERSLWLSSDTSGFDAILETIGAEADFEAV